MNNFVISTTINPISKSMMTFSDLLSDWFFVLVGDRKSVFIESINNIKFLSLENQRSLKYNIISSLPYNHYARKNIGYLYALSQGSKIIYETDDDNIPFSNWKFPPLTGNFDVYNTTKFLNVYQFFTSEFIWPRGFPLINIHQNVDLKKIHKTITIGAWQGLADDDPDVDAIYRLVFDKKIKFDSHEPVVLAQGTYCPFNSQNTLWHHTMLPYAYLPSTVSFRFTDILRSYVAQRCFWEHGYFLGFTKPTVYQERNQHDYMKDFESEITCYLQAINIVNILDSLKLNNDWERNLMVIYTTFAKKEIVRYEEINIVKSWIQDINTIL